MNERTIQLYKQAVDFAYTTAGKDAGKGTVVEGLTAGKFAELIVRECSGFRNELGVALCTDPGALHRYFGVEE